MAITDALLAAGKCAILILITFHLSNASSFPQVKGPKSKSDKIAIIGAGPAGVHMAYLLKKNGFNNIVILEQSNRIGGKSYAINYHDTHHEMGTMYMTALYEEIFKLIDEFQVGELVSYPERSFWVNQTHYSGLLGYLALASGIHDGVQLQSRLFNEVNRYTQIHRDVFGDYEGQLMPRPDSSAWNTIRGTFKDFLDRNNFRLLQLIFISSHTAQGYGELNDVAAFYGLLWMSPKLIQSLLDPDTPRQFALNTPFEKLWQNIVYQMGIDVELGVDIKRIKRGYFGNDPIMINYEYKFVGCSRARRFDFLVLTPSMPSLMDIVDFSFNEERLFYKLTDKSYFITSLFHSVSGKRSTSPLNHYSFNQRSGRPYTVWGSVDTYAASRNYTGADYQDGETNGAEFCDHCQTVVLYQYGTRNPNFPITRRMIRKRAVDHFQYYEQENAVLIDYKIWEYFVHFPPQAIETGIIWDIFEMQGTRNTWYTGGSVIFESILNIVDYNLLIFNNANLPA